MFKLRSLRCFVAGAGAKTGTNSGEEGEKTTHYGWSPLRMHDVGLNPQLSCLTPSPPLNLSHLQGTPGDPVPIPHGPGLTSISVSSGDHFPLKTDLPTGRYAHCFPPVSVWGGRPMAVALWRTTLQCSSDLRSLSSVGSNLGESRVRVTPSHDSHPLGRD